MLYVVVAAALVVTVAAAAAAAALLRGVRYSVIPLAGYVIPVPVRAFVSAEMRANSMRRYGSVCVCVCLRVRV